MAAAGGPLERMQAKVERRFRWFTVYHAIVVAIAVVAIGWIALPSGSQDLVWIFVYAAVVLIAGVPPVWWMNRRVFRRTMGVFERLRPWISDVDVAPGRGYLLILDRDVVLAMDSPPNVVNFMAFFSAGGALLRPDVAQARRWAARIRGMKTRVSITKRAGPPEAQAELERFREAFGARWYMLFFREVRADRLAAGEPMFHESLGFFIPRFSDRAQAVAERMDALIAFLETAPARYFLKAATTA